jgi:hypothetical protein
MAKGNESLASIKSKEAAFYGVDSEDFTDRGTCRKWKGEEKGVEGGWEGWREGWLGLAEFGVVAGLGRQLK